VLLAIKGQPADTNPRGCGFENPQGHRRAMCWPRTGCLWAVHCPKKFGPQGDALSPAMDGRAGCSRRRVQAIAVLSISTMRNGMDCCRRSKGDEAEKYICHTMFITTDVFKPLSGRQWLACAAWCLPSSKANRLIGRERMKRFAALFNAIDKAPDDGPKCPLCRLALRRAGME